MNFDTIRIKTELSAGLNKLTRIQELVNTMDVNNLNIDKEESLQMNIIHYAEFVLKVCEHLCAKNKKYIINMTNYQIITVAIELGVLNINDKADYFALIKLRNRVVHEYTPPTLEEVYIYCKCNLDVLYNIYVQLKAILN